MIHFTIEGTNLTAIIEPSLKKKTFVDPELTCVSKLFSKRDSIASMYTPFGIHKAERFTNDWVSDNRNPVQYVFGRREQKLEKEKSENPTKYIGEEDGLNDCHGNSPESIFQLFISVFQTRRPFASFYQCSPWPLASFFLFSRLFGLAPFLTLTKPKYYFPWSVFFFTKEIPVQFLCSYFLISLDWKRYDGG